MASRRIAKSAVDWVAFAERVPPNQKDAFRAFKGKSDIFLGRVLKYPENLPKIDWAHYKSRIATPGMVDQFEKAYQGLNLAYPKDKDNITAQIDAEEKEAAVRTKQEVAKAQQTIEEAKVYLSKIDSVPKLTEMTQEMYADYFPDQARNPDKPTFWPHNKSDQPGNNPNLMN